MYMVSLCNLKHDLTQYNCCNVSYICVLFTKNNIELIYKNIIRHIYIYTCSQFISFLFNHTFLV